MDLRGATIMALCGGPIRIAVAGRMIGIKERREDFLLTAGEIAVIIQ
jgi:hypothetical protein